MYEKEIVMHFVFSADYSMGVGDFLVKLYAICHLKKYIQHNIPNTKFSFVIEEYKSDVLKKILDLDFFSSFFDEFRIIHCKDVSIQGLGSNTLNYFGSDYNRTYSAINESNSNRQGYWESYCNKNPDSNIPYHDFDYRDPSSRQSKPIPDYGLSIFQKRLLDSAEKFVADYLNNNFVSIYYRSLFELNNQHLVDSAKCIVSHYDPDKKYFITTNSDKAKDYLLKQIPNSVCYVLPQDKPDGYGTADADQADIERLFIEMFIMAYGSSILYAGNHHYISLYNYYAHMIKQVPLINC